MAKDKTTRQVEALLGKMLIAAENSQQSGYEWLSKRKSKKAARRKAVEERLTKTLDAKDPRLQMAKIKADRTGETAAAFKQRVTRLKKKPQLGKKDWMASGNVRHANGRAAAGLTVQVYDKDLKFDDLLGKTTTDDFGDFRVVYDIRRFDDEWGNARPDLFLQILDKDGKLLAAHTEPLRMNAGNVEYFEVVISLSSTSKGRGKSK